jgi:trans-aconitate methyltransferase
MAPHSPTIVRPQASNYNVRTGDTLSRLHDQSLLHQPLHAKMIAAAEARLGNPARLKVIDLGCASGNLTEQLFADEKYTVMGIDCDAVCIGEAQHRLRMTDFVGETIDVESSGARALLRDAIKRFAGDEPVLLFSSLVFHHLGDPEAVLSLLKSLLPSGSVVAITSPDDGLKVGYPDQQLLHRIVQLTAEAPGESNRFHGRQLHAQLGQAGFQTVETVTDVIALDGLETRDRDRLFHAHYGHRLARWDRVIATGHLPAANGLREELSTLLSTLQRKFHDSDYFYTETLLASIAEVA